MLKCDKKVIRNAILDFVKNGVDNPIKMKGYALDSAYLHPIIFNVVGTEILDENEYNEMINEYIEIIKQDECFRFEDKITEEGIKIKDGIIRVVKVPLEYKLKEIQSKYNIAVDSIKDNIDTIAYVAGGITVLTISIVGMIYFINSADQKFEKYEKSLIVNDDKEYQMKDIYVVYDAYNVYFCNKNINMVTEDDKISGTFIRGYGKVDEYYYRDEIYSYYDIKTGKEICHDHEEGFYIEKLMDFYNVDQMADKNYKINLSEISNDINNDYLLSRDPGLRRK